MTEPVPGGFGDFFPDYSYGSELFINVEAYDPDGNLEYVRILLNGEILGEAQGRFGNTYIYKWVIEDQPNAFEPFVLQAVVMDNDRNFCKKRNAGWHP